MNDISSELSSHPGRILRAAREELNYSVDRVADKLHLRSSVVEAMEQEKYESFSSEVFLKGYFRSYCRLVNLHEERMVEFLEQLLKTRQHEFDEVISKTRRKKQIRARNKITAVLVLGIVIASLAIFILDSISDSETAKREASINKKQKATTGLQTATSSTKVMAQKQSLNPPLDTPINRVLVDKEIDQEINPRAENNAAATLRNANARKDSDKHQTPLSSPLKTLFEARFSGDCWFKLVDAGNKTVFATLKKANDIVSYAGLAPFRIVLGDASKVSLSFNNKEVDLKPFTSENGRAAFTLGEQQ